MNRAVLICATKNVAKLGLFTCKIYQGSLKFTNRISMTKVQRVSKGKSSNFVPRFVINVATLIPNATNTLREEKKSMILSLNCWYVYAAVK